MDIGAAKLADTPEAFDVIVMPNLYGDILSDVAAQIAGSVGLAGSANIGDHCAMFEAIHGSAPRRAGQNLANPSGLLLGGVMMLVHIGQWEVAERVHNAWLRTIEDGIHTYDIFEEGISKQKVGTKEFAQAVVARMGQKPQISEGSFVFESGAKQNAAPYVARPRAEEGSGRRGRLTSTGTSATRKKSGKKLRRSCNGDGLELIAVSNRGTKVYPEGFAETFCTDHWRCRFMRRRCGDSRADRGVAGSRMAAAGLDFIKIENLLYVRRSKRVRRRRRIASPMDDKAPLVGVIMGSKSDWETIERTSETLHGARDSA